MRRRFDLVAFLRDIKPAALGLVPVENLLYCVRPGRIGKRAPRVCFPFVILKVKVDLYYENFGGTAEWPHYSPNSALLILILWS